MVLVLSIAVLIPVSATQDVKVEKQNYLVGFNGEINKGLVKAFGVNDEAILHEYIYIPTVLMELTEAQANALAKNPKIEYVERDAEVFALAQTVPWGISKVQATTAHSYGYKGAGVKVAVLDTGIAYHSDLDANVKGGYSVFGDSYRNDVQGHGTHVAGTIAAVNNTIGVIGVAPSASLYAVKVLDNNGSGTLSGIAQGIDWARQNGMNVINMSLGGTTGSTTLSNACNNAYNAGVVVVAAAGNSGNSAGTGDNVGYPAKYSSVIAVAATDSNNVRAYFSSTGPAVEISAPGYNIYSTLRTGSYGNMSGTSMACPHVAGVAALVKGADPSASASAIRTAMNESALYLGTWNWYGNGLVRAVDAINYSLAN